MSMFKGSSENNRQDSQLPILCPTCKRTSFDERTRDKSSRKLLHTHPPFFITFITIFQLVIFTFYAILADEPISMTGPTPVRSSLVYSPLRRLHQPWRYVTYMFVHAGYWHLIFNLLIQLAVGVPLEVVHGFNPIFIIYIGGVIAGALGNSIADPHTYLAGASSGCYALIAAHLSSLIINWKEMRGACIKLLTLLIFTTADFGTAIYERHFKQESIAYRTSYGGHLAGALSGLLLGLVFLHNVRVHHWERVVKCIAATIYATLVILAILFNLIYTDYFPQPDFNDITWSQNPFMQDRRI